jgi:metal-responsive CopG/Arc/MetJ family transcriptional regulator
MAEYEKIAISLRPDDLAFVDDIAQEKAVGRSAVIRWAIAHYRSLFLPDNSACRTNREEGGVETEIEPAG